MQTECPHCQAVFRVTTEQLRSAHGEVRCGACRLSFDAIVNLRVEETESGPGPGPGPGVAPPPPPPAEASDESVPEILREDLRQLRQRTRMRRRTTLFTIASLLALVLLAGQYTWFEPNAVSKSYPQARRWVERFCEHAQCVLPERHDPSQFRLTGRDVRVHPKYEGALQILVTFVNGAAFSQRHPRLRFTLFNVNGQVIASRVFNPVQYLRGEAARRSLLATDASQQIALEVLAPDEAAVSFEFQFL